MLVMWLLEPLVFKQRQNSHDIYFASGGKINSIFLMEVFRVLTGVGVDVLKLFGVGAGVLKPEAGAVSEKSDSTHLCWHPWDKRSESPLRHCCSLIVSDWALPVCCNSEITYALASLSISLTFELKITANETLVKSISKATTGLWNDAKSLRWLIEWQLCTFSCLVYNLLCVQNN